MAFSQSHLNDIDSHIADFPKRPFNGKDTLDAVSLVSLTEEEETNLVETYVQEATRWSQNYLWARICELNACAGHYAPYNDCLTPFVRGRMHSFQRTPIIGILLTACLIVKKTVA